MLNKWAPDYARTSKPVITMDDALQHSQFIALTYAGIYHLSPVRQDDNDKTYARTCIFKKYEVILQQPAIPS